MTARARSRPLALALLGVCLALAAAQGQPRYPNGDLLIEPTELAGRLDEDQLLILDVRSLEAYEEGHVPGAVHLPVDRIAVRVDGVPFEFDADTVRAAFEGVGLRRDEEVVIYDDLGMMSAARLFWTLELTGHTHARILHGGWNAWTRAELPREREPVQPDPSRFEVDLQERLLITADELASRLEDPALAVVDARSRAEYTGEVAFAERGGRIPGAVHLPWFDALTGGDTLPATEPGWQDALRDDDVERFRAADEVRELLAARGLRPELEVVTYCQTLWRGAHAYFLLRLMGYEDVRGYDGSWAEWGNREDLPVERGGD